MSIPFGEQVWNDLQQDSHFQAQATVPEFAQKLEPFIKALGISIGVLTLTDRIATIEDLLQIHTTFLNYVSDTLQQQGQWSAHMQQTIGSWLAMSKQLAATPAQVRDPVVIGLLNSNVVAELQAGRLTVQRLLQLQPTWIIM